MFNLLVHGDSPFTSPYGSETSTIGGTGLGFSEMPQTPGLISTFRNHDAPAILQAAS
jgi:hypothetical protein